MLNLYLRFVLQFISIIHYLFNLTKANDLSSRNQCQSGWHYLSEELTTCITFTTSQAGDISWYDSYKACQTSSSQLLILLNSIKFQLVEKKFHQLKYDNQLYIDYIHRGVWIGKAKWSKDHLCDSTSTTIEDLQLNCIILTISSNNQNLCLKRVPCKEKHPFICQNRAMTEKELVESTMERLTWWKCIVVIWCIVDHNKEKEREKEQAIQIILAQQAAIAAELQAYVGQFVYDIPEELINNGDGQISPHSKGNGLKIAGYKIPNWIVFVGGGFIFLLTICICCVVFICIYKMKTSRRSRQNPGRRHDSFDSTYSR